MSPRSYNSYTWCTRNPLAIACQFILCPKPTHCIKWFYVLFHVNHHYTMSFCDNFDLIIFQFTFWKTEENSPAIFTTASPLVYTLTVLSGPREHSPPLPFPLSPQYFWGNHYWLPSVLTLGKIEGWKASCNLTQAGLKTGILLSQGIRLSVVWKTSYKAFCEIGIPKICSKEEDWKQPSLWACYNWHALVQVQRDSRLAKSNIYNLLS